MDELSKHLWEKQKLHHSRNRMEGLARMRKTEENEGNRHTIAKGSWILREAAADGDDHLRAGVNNPGLRRNRNFCDGETKADGNEEGEGEEFEGWPAETREMVRLMEGYFNTLAPGGFQFRFMLLGSFF